MLEREIVTALVGGHTIALKTGHGLVKLPAEQAVEMAYWAIDNQYTHETFSSKAAALGYMRIYEWAADWQYRDLSPKPGKADAVTKLEIASYLIGAALMSAVG